MSVFEKAVCKNCKHYFKKDNQGYCKQRPTGARLIDEDGTIGELLNFKETNSEDHCSYFDNNTEDVKNSLIDAYNNINDLLRKYCDLNEEDYSLVATWIMGTYMHDQFESYPYLFLNAMKGSGKTRTLKLITDLSKDGEMILSPTEAVLFRTKSTLGIDEFESLTRKGQESLLELLNACYKKGNKVKRMKQKKSLEGGMEQVVEEFDVYRPLVLANINGMEDVLGDRCINIVLERSQNKRIIQLIEVWKHEKVFKKTVKILNQCCLCRSAVIMKVYQEWNSYIYTNNINNTYNTNNTNNIELFKRLNLLDLDGRTLELTLPLLLIAWHLSPQIFENNYTNIKNYTATRKQEQFQESRDISFIDYVSQETENSWISIKSITHKFREFLQTNDEEINPKWIGRVLKRLKLKSDTRRMGGGAQVILNIPKAQEKIRMFK